MGCGWSAGGGFWAKAGAWDFGRSCGREGLERRIDELSGWFLYRYTGMLWGDWQDDGTIWPVMYPCASGSAQAVIPAGVRIQDFIGAESRQGWAGRARPGRALGWRAALVGHALPVRHACESRNPAVHRGTSQNPTRAPRDYPGFPLVSGHDSVGRQGEGGQGQTLYPHEQRPPRLPASLTPTRRHVRRSPPPLSFPLPRRHACSFLLPLPRGEGGGEGNTTRAHGQMRPTC